MFTEPTASCQPMLGDAQGTGWPRQPWDLPSWSLFSRGGDRSVANDSPEWIVLGGGGTARGVKAMIVGLRQRGQDQGGGTWAEGSRSRWRHRERGQGWDEGGRGVCPSPEMALDSTL